MISTHPLVSVIIPVYNAEKYIKDAIISILEQTYKAFEIIIVDDFSSDNSVKIISDFKDVHLIQSSKNRGAGYSRNCGINSSKGEIIAFLDADDHWVPEMLEFQIDSLLKNKDIDGVYGMFENYFEPGEPLPAGIEKEKFLKPGVGKIKNLGTMVLYKNIFAKVGMFSETIKSGEDIDWFVRADDYGVKFLYSPRLLMYRRLHGENLTFTTYHSNQRLLEILSRSIQRKREQRK